VRVFDLGGGDEPAVVTNRVLTIPNLLSLARLLVLPWLYWLLVSDRFLLALAVGFVFASTDWFDGFIARRFDQVTRLGQLLDPVSDRLFIVTVMIGLVVADVVPLALAVAIVARDVLLLAGGAVLLGGGRVTPPVTRLGKAATFGMIWSFPWLLVGAHLATIDSGHAGWVRFVGLAVAWAATAAYWVVGVGYVRALRAAGQADDAPPTPPSDSDEGPGRGGDADASRRRESD
jgi:cardiolipin synthase